MAPTDNCQPLTLRQFWDRLERRREEVDAAVVEAAGRSSVFAEILASMDDETRQQQQTHARALQREALVEGHWDRYLEDLRGQGARYAQLGIPFHEWFPIVSAFRPPIIDDLLPRKDTTARGVLDGLNAFVDGAMAEIGAAYVDKKEQMLRDAQGRLQRYIDLVAAAPLAQVVVEIHADDGTLRTPVANPAALQLTAAAPTGTGELADMATWLLERGVADECRRALSAGALQRSTLGPALPGDDERHFDVRCFPLDDRHVAVTLEDVTDRRALQARVAAHIRDLERSNRELDEFAYVTSHDLKAPLQDIRNLARWVSQDIADILPDDSSRHLALLVDRVDRMEQLLDDLLDYSRVGRSGGAPSQVRFWDLVDEVVAYVQPPPQFEVRHDGVSPVLKCPRPPLEKVLRNLIQNAIRHHDRSQGLIIVSATEVGDRVRISVTDDGPGIPPEYAERVFRMFQTLRPRDQVAGGGSGIGLALVKKAVESLGGEVGLRSNGRGTTVCFTWPKGVRDSMEAAS